MTHLKKEKKQKSNGYQKVISSQWAWCNVTLIPLKIKVPFGDLEEETATSGSYISECSVFDSHSLSKACH